MNTIIENKLKELYSIVMSKPLQILDIFNNFFGKDKVDMQGFPDIESFNNWIMNDMELRAIAPNNSSIYTEDFNYLTYRYNSLSSIPESKCIEAFNSMTTASIIEATTEASIFRQGFILVHFPHVRITNEYDRYVDINHLYAKIRILTNGTMNGYFGLNRAEYSYLHISSGYMHSHVSSIPFYEFTDFQTPCTGSGPINHTMSNLFREFDSDIWELFCLELSKYVEVESIEGVPYHRLETLGTLASDTNVIPNKFEVVNRLYYPNCLSCNMLKEFTSYFIKQGKLKFDYRDGSYSVGMSLTEYMITISNAFIDWYNDMFNNEVYSYTLHRFIREKVLKKCIIANNKIYIDNPGHDMNSYKQYIGEKICTFKGQDILVNITDIDEVNTDNISYILDTKIALYILSKILYVINYRYGKSEQRSSEGNRTSETVRYF